MKIRYFVFILWCLITLGRKTGAKKSMGPIGNIVLNAVYECAKNERPKGDEMKYTVNVERKNGKKVLSLTFDSKVALDEEMKYELELKKTENGGWKKFYNVKGSPCEDLQRHIKSLWATLRSMVNPVIENPCPVEPGSYKVDKIYVDTTDIDIKSVFYGKLLMKTTVSDKDDKRLLCIMVELESQAPV